MSLAKTVNKNDSGTWTSTVGGDAYSYLADSFETIVERIKDELVPLLHKGSLEFRVSKLCQYIKLELTDQQQQYACKAMSKALGIEIDWKKIAEAQTILVDAISMNPKYDDVRDRFETFLNEAQRDREEIFGDNPFRKYDNLRNENLKEKQKIILKKEDRLSKKLWKNGVKFKENKDSIEIPLENCASKLEKLIDDFDRNCVPPYNTDGVSAEEIKESFDKSGVQVAKMCKLLFRYLEHCDFKEHSDILILAREIVEEFDNCSMPGLQKLELGYYEKDQLLLLLDEKLGVDLPSALGEKKDPRRRTPKKDPDQIEVALVDCLNAIIPLREKIVSVARQGKFDQLFARTCEELIPIHTDAPHENSDPQAKLRMIVERLDDKFKADKAVRSAASEDAIGKRIRMRPLLGACKTIQQIGKWIRKTDFQLEDTEITAGKKREILAKFDKLSDVALGRDPSQRNITPSHFSL